MDKTIKCKDCGVDFVFTDAEQKYFEKLIQDGKIAVYNEPKRCSKCRQIKKNSQVR